MGRNDLISWYEAYLVEINATMSFSQSLHQRHSQPATRGGNGDHYNKLSTNHLINCRCSFKNCNHFYFLWIDSCWPIKHQLTSCCILCGVRRKTTLTRVVTHVPQMCWRKQTPENKTVENNTFFFPFIWIFKCFACICEEINRFIYSWYTWHHRLQFRFMMLIIKNSDIFVGFFLMLLPASQLPFHNKMFRPTRSESRRNGYCVPSAFGTKTVGLQCLCLRLYLIELVIFEHPHHFSAKQNICFLSGALYKRRQWSFLFKQQ